MSDQYGVLFITEVAELLRTSRRTLERRIKAGDDLPPMLPSIDKRPRWTRAAVEEWLKKPAASISFQRRRWS